jgi:hypothetical protein
MATIKVLFFDLIKKICYLIEILSFKQFLYLEYFMPGILKSFFIVEVSW